jgi:hypothetical protein
MLVREWVTARVLPIPGSAFLRDEGHMFRLLPLAERVITSSHQQQAAFFMKSIFRGCAVARIP